MYPCRHVAESSAEQLTSVPPHATMPHVLDTDRRTTPSTAAPLLVAGGLTWLPARWGVMTTWDSTWLGLDYAAWNRVTLIPLALLTAGALLAGRRRPRARRIAWTAVATGFATSWLGVALEFVVGGGLQGGPRDVAVAGWTLYLLGTALTALGALALAASCRSTDGPAAAAAGLAGATILAWPALLAAGLDSLAVADQLLLGLLWAAIGVRTAQRPR